LVWWCGAARSFETNLLLFEDTGSFPPTAAPERTITLLLYGGRAPGDTDSDEAE
jgi:hypothetical protein